MKLTQELFDKHRRKWLDDCQKEWTASEYCTQIFDYDIEFTDDGSAYLHNVDGTTGHIPDAVTPWEKSEHFVK